MDIINDILIALISGVSHEYLVSIGVVIILTAVLVFIDTAQRVAIEVLRYNKDNHRPNNPITLLTTLTWYGWGKGKYLDETTGERRRYLMSERLRGDLLKKLCIQYPAWMILSIVFISLPDIQIPNTYIYVDHLFSYAFMLMPFFSECWSIIENLREIVEDDLIDIGKVFKYAIEVIKAWRGNGQE